MATSRTLKLGLLADVAQFGRGMSKASADAKQFSTKTSSSINKVSTAFKGMGIAAGYAFAKITKESITAASDLNEEMSKTSVIFGETAADMKKFASTAGKALGISKTAALRAAGTFAVFGKAAGISGSNLNDFSKDLVGLSSDLASFYNTSTDDAILAIGSALRGEMEPIRKYGVLLSQATLEQAALNYETKNGVELERGITGALTGSGKVLATYQAILENTTLAQGDFSRTSEGLANQQRILSAGVENAKTSFGEALLPIMTKLVNYANDTFIPTVKKIADGFSGKPDSISNKLKVVGRDLGYAPDSGAYNLGKSLRDVAKSMGELIAVVTGDGATGAAGSLQKIADALTAVANAIQKVSDAYNSPLFKAARKASNFINPLSKLGKIPGLGLDSAYGVGEFKPRSIASISPAMSTSNAGNTFIFNGVIDGESARRSIETLMRNSARRSGQVSLVGNAL